MKQFLANVQFSQPFFLWVLAALPLLWLWFRRRGMFVLIWRTLILALIIAILADPQYVTWESRTEQRIYAFDLSESISGSMRQWMVNKAREADSPKRGDLLFVFAGGTEKSEHWQATLQDRTGERKAIQPQKTNLEQLFTTLLNLSSGGAHDVFLFTDGWQTAGNVERMFPAIAASGLRIYPVLPAQHLDFANVSVTKLVAPSQGKSGESIALKVSLENQSQHTIDGTLTLSRAGQVFKTDRVQLKPGSQIFTYRTSLPDKPLTSYRANFTPRQPQWDRYAPDNQALAWVSVRTKAKVLLLNGRPGGGRYLEEIFRRQGYEVDSPPPESAPALTGYSVVVLNNVEREKLSPSYLTAIERHVADGNGFIMIGSEWSFGPGGYRDTPVETILPVEFKEPKREEKHRAVVLVIDKSGSMREDNRILYAQEAARAVARQLKDDDLLGVVGFDINPFIVVPISKVGSIRGTVDRQIARLKPGGRTFLLPAIIEAKRQLERQNASTKHVIILSDGETGGSGGDYIDLVNVMKTEQKITVSTVAIGTEANVPLMKRISQYGGGFFHHTYDPTTLPQVVVQQLREKPKDERPVEKRFTPVQERGSEVLGGFPGRNYPSLTGYIETQLKRNGHLDLVLPRDGRRVPLLASWHYGRGKTAAFTTDMEGRWSRNWIPWSALDEFWEKVMNWLRPVSKSVAIPLHETRIGLSGNQPLLDLYLYEDVGRDSQFHFSLSGTPGKLEGVFKKLAPGHYQTALPISAKGDYRINLFEERAGQRIAYPPVGYTLPYDLNHESPRPDFNIPLLTKLAQISGGEINPRSPIVSPKQHETASYRPLRAPLIILCWVLFFMEVLVRQMLLRGRRVSAISHPPL